MQRVSSPRSSGLPRSLRGSGHTGKQPRRRGLLRRPAEPIPQSAEHAALRDAPCGWMPKATSASSGPTRSARKRARMRLHLASLLPPLAEWRGDVLRTERHFHHSSGEAVFAPRIAVDRRGVISVVWEDDAAGGWEIFYSRSVDGGVRFSVRKSFPITPVPR